jgi:hypothetical protein
MKTRSNAMLITLISAHEGKIKLQIRQKTGFEYKEIEIEKLHDYLTAMEFYCDSHQEEFVFRMNDKMKNYVAERLKEMEQLYNNKGNA